RLHLASAPPKCDTGRWQPVENRPAEDDTMRTRTLLTAAAVLTVGGLLGRLADTFAQDKRPAAVVADQLYHGGPVLTADDRNPSAEAVAVKGGKIVAVGKNGDVLKLKGDATEVIDLNGKALVPGFIDAHGHLMGVGLQRSVANLLPPPDGKGDSIAGLQALLK